MKMILLFLMIGLSIGGVSGTLGIGGGVLLVPALTLLLGFEQRQAAGTTLAVLAVPVALPAVWKYYELGLLKPDHLKAAAWIAGAFVVGSYSAASVVSHVPVSLLRLGFGLMLIYIAAHFLLASDSEVANAAFGLLAVIAAWLAYLGLRLLGRRHTARPSLGQKIREMQEGGWGDSDYHI
jgi:uncharacterized membrane protein YfcA